MAIKAYAPGTPCAPRVFETFFFPSGGAQARAPILTAPCNSRFFPSLISVLLSILGVVMFIQGWHKRGRENQETYVLEKREAILVVLTLGTGWGLDSRSAE